MARSAFIAVLCSLVASSLACSCLAPPPFRQAITEAKFSDSPYAVATVISEDRPADINGLVTYTLRTDGCPSTVIATTCGNGACCGTVLKVNTKYVIRLKKNGARSSVSLCGVQREYNSISSADRAFVDANVTGRCVASSCAAVTCVDGDICVDGKCAKQIPFKPSLIGTKYEVFRGSCGFLRGDSMKVTILPTRLADVQSLAALCRRLSISHPGVQAATNSSSSSRHCSQACRKLIRQRQIALNQAANLMPYFRTCTWSHMNTLLPSKKRKHKRCMYRFVGLWNYY